MKANKTFFTLVVSLLLAVTAFAQESTSKQINKIKRDSDYLYAEATMETAEEALSVARELLMQQVQEYIGEKEKLSQAKDVLVKNVNAKSESISMMRGTMYRMFVYVKKSDIEAVKNVTAINTATNTTTVVVEQPVPPVPAPEKPVKQEVVEVVEETVVVVEEPVLEEPHAEEIVTEVVESQGEPVTETGLPVWQQQAISDLLECADITAVKAKLNRMKAEYKVKKYGTPNNCPNANEAYWVFFNADGSVNTVLGTGATDRISFRDMQLTSLDKYKGMNALWFNFAK